MKHIHTTLRSITIVLFLATTPLLCHAHEFWVRPDAHRVPSGGLLGLTLMHGERFMGQPVARNSPMILRYELVSESHDPVPVAGMHGSTQGYLRPEHAGVVVYQTRHYRNDLPAERFREYLDEEGLGQIALQRETLGESDLPGREVYARCAKSIVLIEGDARDASQIDHDTGLPLEITLTEINADDDTARVRAVIVFEGKPVDGLRVVAVHASDPDGLIELSTDEHGAVSFDAAPGGWMLTALHIRRADHAQDADWESFWASSTFSIDG